MKNVSEACEATFVYKIDGKLSEPVDETFKSKIAHDVEHWRGVDDEIRNCHYVHIFVAQMVVMVSSGKMGLAEALMATAVQFSAVGIEMQREELQLPDPSVSVPGRRDGYTGI